MVGFHKLNDRRRRIEAHRREAVAELLSENLSVKAVAEQLQVSTRTVDKDLAAIRSRLGAQAV